MKNIRWIICLLIVLGFGGAAHAQFPCTSSPNVGFQVPNIGNTTTWGLCLNTDLSIIDSLFGGTSILTNATATPAISAATTWITSNTGAQAITNFTGGFAGQTIQVVCGVGDTFTSLASGANLSLSSAWSCSSSKAITLVLNSGVWYEMSRNGGFGSSLVSPVTSPNPLVFQVNIANKGPNPHADITAGFGGYITSSPTSIVCNTTIGLNTLSCPLGTSDFSVGQGIAVPGAGPATTLSVPGAAVGIFSLSISSNVATIVLSHTASFTDGTSITGAGMTDATLDGSYTNVQMSGYGTLTASFPHANCSPCSFGSGTFTAPTTGAVTPLGQTGGSTTWCYQIAARDSASLGYSAATSQYCTTSGWATLGPQTYTIQSNGCSVSGGIATITTTAPHNIPNSAGQKFNISAGTTGSPALEGRFRVLGTTSNTVTMYVQSLPNGNYCASGGTLQVIAKNEVQWLPQPGQPGAGTGTSSHLVWRNKNGGSFSLVAITQGTDSSLFDQGLPAPSLAASDAAYISTTTPPTAPVNGILNATITSIVGTVITFSGPSATASISSAAVLHDNTEAVVAACNSFGGDGGTIYVPGEGGAVFNSLLNLGQCSSDQLEIVFGAQPTFNQPVIPRSATTFSGNPLGSGGGIAPFAVGYQTTVTIEGYPGFLIPTGPGGTAITFNDLNISTFRSYQSGIYQDEDTVGDGTVDIRLNNTSVSGSAGSQPWHIGGGFGVFVHFGSFGIGGTTQWGYPAPVLNRVNCGLGQNNLQLSGIWNWNEPTFSGGGLEWDTCGHSQVNSSPGNTELIQPLCEGCLSPLFDFGGITAGNLPAGYYIYQPSFADSPAGSGIPMIDASQSAILAFTIYGSGINNCGNGSQPLFAAGPNQSAEIHSVSCNYTGLSKSVSIGTSGIGLVNASLSTIGGQLFYSMSTPTAPSLTLNLTSPVTAGVYCYAIIAQDVNGNQTAASPSSSCVTADGSHGILINWTPVVGQFTTTLCRGSAPNAMACAANVGGAAYGLPGMSYQEVSPGFDYSVDVPTSTSAGSSGIGINGLFGYQAIFPSNGFAMTVSGGGFTADQSATWPNASGPIALEIFGSLTTTSATSDNVTLTGMTASGHCLLTPTNSSAATNWTTTFVSAKTTNQITVTHTATSGMTYDIGCAPY